MAPEQARGDRDLTSATDVFSLGCVAFECIAGSPPFGGGSPLGVLARILFEPIPRLSERAMVSPRLDDLVARMMAREPTKRPALDPSFFRALEELANDEPSTTRRIVRAGRPRASTVWSVVVAELADAAESVESATLRMLTADTTCRLDDGLTLLGFRADGRIDIAAARALAAAQELEPHAARVAVTTGPGDGASPLSLGSVVDHACELLRRGDDAMAVDALTKELTSRRSDGTEELPFVGRRSELAVLEQAIGEAIDQDRGALIGILGEAGLGKTRLARECADRAARMCRMRLLRGHTDPIAPRAPLGLVVSLLRGAYRTMQELERELERCGVSGFAEHAYWLGAAARLEGYQASAHRAGDKHAANQHAADNARARRDRLLVAFVAWLVGLSAERPLLIVLDDVQWADRSSLALLLDSLPRVCKRPIVGLLISRPTDSPFGELADHLTRRVQLGRLSKPASRQLLAGLPRLGGEASVERIMDLAEGHPLFLLEAARASEHGDDALPESIVAITQSRIASQPDAVRHALSAAAVLGLYFRRRDVAGLLGEDCNHLLQCLEDKELIRREPGEDRFEFQHELVRRAAYSLIGAPSCAALHDRAAQWLVSCMDRGDPGIDAHTIADHYRLAGSPIEAAAWFKEAAAKALDSGDHDGALACARAVSELTERAEDRAWALGLEAETLLYSGLFSEAIARGREALQTLTPTDPGWNHAAVAILAACYRVGDELALEALVKRLEQVLAKAAPPDGTLTIAARAAFYLYLFNETVRADELLALTERRMHERAIRLGDRAWVSMAHGIAAELRGDCEQNIELIEQDADDLQSVGDERSAAIFRYNMAVTCVFLGDYARAEPLLLWTVERTRLLCMRPLEVAAIHALCLAAYARGDITSARQYCDEAIELAMPMPEIMITALLFVDASKIAFAEGDHERAFELIQRSREHCKRPELLARGSLQRTWYLLQLGRIAEAREAFDLALEERPASRADPTELREPACRHVVQIALLIAEGQLERGHIVLREALGDLRERTSRLRSPRLRTSYQRTTWNRELWSLATSLEGEVPKDLRPFAPDQLSARPARSG